MHPINKLYLKSLYKFQEANTNHALKYRILRIHARI